MFHGWIISRQWSTEIQQVHIEVLISLQTPLNFMWYDREMCASMQQQLNRLNSWHSSRLNAVIKHVKNRKRVVSISSPGGETVKWIKKSRSSCPEVFCKKEVLKIFSKFTGKHLYRRLFKKELQVSRLYHNLLQQFPHISKANFAISFSSENIKTENGSF